MPIDDTHLSKDTPLAFPIQRIDGPPIANLGEAADFLSQISDEKRQKSHWQVAVRMLDHALHEPAYLKTATMSLQTALAMDGLIDQMQS